MADSLAGILAAARRDRGWSLREAERHSGVSNAHLSQIETGAIRQPGLVILAGLAGAYGIPLRVLVAAAGLTSLASVAAGQAVCEQEYRDGGRAFRRLIIVVEDWTEVPGA